MTEAGFKVAMDVDDYPEIRDTIRKICEEFPALYWRDLEKQPIENRYPEEFLQTMTEAGFLAPLVPESYGGVELPMRAAAVIIEGIHEAGCNAAGCIAQIHLTELLARHGTDAQKQMYLPQIAEGNLSLQALAVSEPESGMDIGAMSSIAEKKGDRYVISGQKNWVRFAANSDLMLMLVRTTPVSDGTNPANGVSLFLIELDQAKGNGLDIKLVDGMNNDNYALMTFSELEISRDSLIGDEGCGFTYLEDVSTSEHILIAAAALGDGKFFVRRATEYANERVVFGNPIGKYQGIQFPIAKAYIETQGADVALRKAIALHDANKDAAGDANVARHLAVESAWAMADAAFTTYGGFAFAREYDIERKWRDVRAMRTATLSSNMSLAFISERVLALPRSY